MFFFFFWRRFFTTFKRLERLFSQPIFTSVLYDINTRDNNELKIRTSPQNLDKKIAVNVYRFLSIVTRLLIYRIPTMTPMIVSRKIHVQKKTINFICFWQGSCRWKLYLILARGSRPKGNNNERHGWSVIFKVMRHIFSLGRGRERTVTKQTEWQECPEKGWGYAELSD